jgi:hypothetical protein
VLFNNVVKKKKECSITFINALESSPVHWAKSQPSGKRLSPGKGGTAEILTKIGSAF